MGQTMLKVSLQRFEQGHGASARLDLFRCGFNACIPGRKYEHRPMPLKSPGEHFGALYSRMYPPPFNDRNC